MYMKEYLKVAVLSLTMIAIFWAIVISILSTTLHNNRERECNYRAIEATLTTQTGIDIDDMYNILYNACTK